MNCQFNTRDEIANVIYFTQSLVLVKILIRYDADFLGIALLIIMALFLLRKLQKIRCIS